MASIHDDGVHVVLKTDNVIFKIDKQNGTSAWFALDDGPNLVDKAMAFAVLSLGDGNLRSSSEVAFEAPDRLHISFADTDKTIVVRCAAHPSHFTFELVQFAHGGGIDPAPDCMVIIARLRTREDEHSEDTGTLYVDDWAISALALNAWTDICVDTRADRQHYLSARSYPTTGVLGSKLALFACPRQAWPGFVEALELQHGLRHPTIRGTWSKQSPVIGLSYLLCLDIAARNLRTFVTFAGLGRFGYILAGIDGWAESNGTFAVHPTNFGDIGRLARAVELVHGEKLRFGLHTLAALVGVKDPYVQTRASDLVRDGAGRLKEFAGCHIPHVGSGLIEEIAENLAGVFNDVKADFLYLDGLAGHRLAFDTDLTNFRRYTDFRWYTDALVTNAFFDRLTRDVLLQCAGYSNFQWHTMSRIAAGDRPFVGIEPYFDFAKLGLGNPGGGHRDVNRRAFMPMELGWIGFHGKRENARALSHAATRPDEIEYVMNRTLGYGLPLSVETLSADLKDNAHSEACFELIGRYETLRQVSTVPRWFLEERLKRPDLALIEDYGLTKEQHRLVGDWWNPGFVRQTYATHYVADATNHKLEVANPFDAQPLKMEIMAVPTSRAFDDPANIELIDTDHLYMYPRESPKDVDFHSGIPGEIRATNAGSSLGWGKITFPLVLNPSDPQVPGLDLSQHKGIGLAVTGDGQGAVVSIELTDGNDLHRQYQCTVDFVGRREMELPMPAMAALFKYPPYPTKTTFRTFNYRNVRQIVIYVKNLQPGQSILIYIGFVKALKQDLLPLKDPAVTLDGKTVLFEAELMPQSPGGNEPHHYLVFDGQHYRVHDCNHRAGQRLAPKGAPPILNRGVNKIYYDSAQSPGKSNRALLRFLMEDDPVYPGNALLP